MAGVLTDVEMANRALARVGEAPANSLDPADGDYEAQVGRLYTSVTESLLSWSDWSFNLIGKTLSRNASPVNVSPRWSYEHQLPPDRLGLFQAVYPGTSQTPFANFEIAGDKLWSNEAVIFGLYRALVVPDLWPGYFRRVTETALAAQYAVSISENRTEHDRLYAQAFGAPSEMGHGGEMAMAELMDAHGRPVDGFDLNGDPLTHARQ